MRCAIDDHATRLELISHTPGAVQIGGEHVSGQPVRRVVGDFDRLCLIGIGYDTQDGAKDFLTCDPHRVTDAGENRGAHEPTASEAFGSAHATCEYRGAFFLSE